MSNATPALKQDAGLLERLSAAVFGPRGAYPIAVAATLAVAGLRLAVAGRVEDNAHFVFFIAPVLIGATLGGAGPGLLATVLGGGLAATFGPDITWAEFTNLIAFLIVSIAISLRGEWLIRVRRDAATATADARAREAHLSSILDTVPDAMVVTTKGVDPVASAPPSGSSATRQPMPSDAMSRFSCPAPIAKTTMAISSVIG